VLTTKQKIQLIVIGLAVTQGLFWLEYALIPGEVPFWMLVANVVLAVVAASYFARSAQRKNAREEFYKFRRPRPEDNHLP
jgi:hypothetical protein